jgi:hypothetical protein
MTRLRWATLTAVAGASFVSGCCGIGQGQILDRLGCHRHRDGECSRLGTGPMVGTMTGPVLGEGPILEDPGTCAGPPAGVLPQPGPMLTPVPGTTAEPPIAQPTPAGPGTMSRRDGK